MTHREISEKFDELFNTKKLPSYENKKRIILNEENSLNGYIFTFSFNNEHFNFFPCLRIERTMFTNKGEVKNEMVWTYEYNPYTLEKCPNIVYPKMGRAYHKDQGTNIDKWDGMLNDAKHFQGVLFAVIEGLHQDFQLDAFTDIWETLTKEFNFVA
jgi:hypothetical protein